LGVEREEKKKGAVRPVKKSLRLVAIDMNIGV